MKKLYFILFIVLLVSGSSVSIVNEDVVYISFFLLIIFLFFDKKINFFIKLKFFLIILIPVIFFWFIHGFQAIVSYFRFFLLIFISCLVCLNYEFNLLAKHFTKLIYFLAVISLFHWAISLLIPLNEYLPQLTSAQGVKYYHTGLSGLQVHNPYRNCSIFWEPGIFSTYLIIALLINSKILKNKLFGYVNIIFIVALISTLSTFGILMMVFTLFFLYLDKSTIKINKFYKYLTNFLVLFFFILISFNYQSIIISLIELNPEIFSKLDFESDSISSGARLFAPLFDFEMFQTSPIFGVGISKYYFLWNELANDPKIIFNVGTSTLTYFLASFGLIFVFFFMYIIKKILFFKSLNSLFLLYLVLLIVVILFKEPHQNFLFSYIAFTYILLNKNE